MSAFLMTPAQHRAQAALLREAGNGQLAQQHDMLATAIERRAGVGRAATLQLVSICRRG